MVLVLGWLNSIISIIYLRLFRFSLFWFRVIVWLSISLCWLVLRMLCCFRNSMKLWYFMFSLFSFGLW